MWANIHLCTDDVWMSGMRLDTWHHYKSCPYSSLCPPKCHSEFIFPTYFIGIKKVKLIIFRENFFTNFLHCFYHLNLLMNSEVKLPEIVTTIDPKTCLTPLLETNLLLDRADRDSVTSPAPAWRVTGFLLVICLMLLMMPSLPVWIRPCIS